MTDEIGKIHLLVIDDDELIRSFIVSLCEECGWPVEQAENGPQGIDIVRRNSERFQVALLDIKMPGPSGLEVLPELMKYSRDLAVIMMSGYAEVDTAVEAMKRGAYDLVKKPIEPEVLVTRIEKAVEQRRIRVENRQYLRDIERRVRERTNEVEIARKAAIFGLARLAESRDKETGGHLERMAGYVVELARALVARGLYRDILDDHYQELLFESAALHDIGKVGIPDALLNKPGKLTENEYKIVQTHTTIGMNAITDIKNLTNGQSFLDIGIEVAGYHHERFDGTGYPNRLNGNSIPLSARILTVADFYDACITPRVYRRYAFPHAEVKNMIAGLSGSHFDPDIADAFLSCHLAFKKLAGV